MLKFIPHKYLSQPTCVNKNYKRGFFSWWDIPKGQETQINFEKDLDSCLLSLRKKMNYNRFAQSGVYVLKNNQNGLVYVGMSINMQKRIQSHFRDGFMYKYQHLLFNNLNEETPKKFSKVSQAIAESDFDFTPMIAEFVNTYGNTPAQANNKLRKKEKFWIEHFKSYNSDKGYNQTK